MKADEDRRRLEAARSLERAEGRLEATILHQSTVIVRGDHYRQATCACGWVGPLRESSESSLMGYSTTDDATTHDQAP